MHTRRDFLRLALAGGGLTLVGGVALAVPQAIRTQQAPFGPGGRTMGPGSGIGPPESGSSMGEMGGMGGMMGDGTTPNVSSAFQAPLFQLPLLMSGFLGDTLLVNGAPFPSFQVAARKYRLRILNGSNARHDMLALANGQPFIVIGTDGGLLPAPVAAPVLSLAPAERSEVVVDFSRVPVGSSVVLQNQMGQGSLAQVMRFDVVRQEPDDSRVPAALRPLEWLDPAQALQADLGIGLLLPCNVVVYDHGDGTSSVEVMDPQAALGIVGDNPAIAEVAREAKARLQIALEHVRD